MDSIKYPADPSSVANFPSSKPPFPGDFPSKENLGTSEPGVRTLDQFPYLGHGSQVG